MDERLTYLHYMIIDSLELGELTASDITTAIGRDNIPNTHISQLVKWGLADRVSWSKYVLTKAGRAALKYYNEVCAS